MEIKDLGLLHISRRVCDELIQLMAHRIRESILDNLRKAGYFSMSVDSFLCGTLDFERSLLPSQSGECPGE